MHAIWDHTVLPAARHSWPSHLYCSWLQVDAVASHCSPASWCKLPQLLEKLSLLSLPAADEDISSNQFIQHVWCTVKTRVMDGVTRGYQSKWPSAKMAWRQNYPDKFKRADISAYNTYVDIMHAYEVQIFYAVCGVLWTVKTCSVWGLFWQEGGV